MKVILQKQQRPNFCSIFIFKANCQSVCVNWKSVAGVTYLWFIKAVLKQTTPIPSVRRSQWRETNRPDYQGTVEVKSNKKNVPINVWRCRFKHPAEFWDFHSHDEGDVLHLAAPQLNVSLQTNCFFNINIYIYTKYRFFFCRLRDNRLCFVAMPLYSHARMELASCLRAL